MKKYEMDTTRLDTFENMHQEMYKKKQQEEAGEFDEKNEFWRDQLKQAYERQRKAKENAYSDASSNILRRAQALHELGRDRVVINHSEIPYEVLNDDTNTIINGINKTSIYNVVFERCKETHRCRIKIELKKFTV